MKKIILLIALMPMLLSAQITNVFIGSAPNDGTGDTLPVAFTKINYNINYFASVLSAGSNYWPVIGADLTFMLTSITNQNTAIANLYNVALTNGGTNYTLSGTFIGDGQQLAINGTNLADGTVSSNALDAAAIAWITSFAPAATMNFDSGVITSDGAGNIHTHGLFLDYLYDQGGSVAIGHSGYVPTANGSGNFYWAAPSGGGITDIQITNTVTLPAGTPAYTTNLGISGGIAYYEVGIPAGANGTNGTPGTNFVTVNQFTNVVLSSQQFAAYQTNYAFWGSSNFLARLNNVNRVTVFGGDDGGNPPSTINGHLVGSFTGTNAWFTVTNNLPTTNYISLAWIKTASGLVNPGSAIIFCVDHPELMGRTNNFFGQHQRFDTPSDPTEAATKSYADTLFANAFNNNFSSYFDTNGTLHFVYSYNNTTLFDLASAIVGTSIASIALDGTGTNILLGIYTTNLPAVIQSSTNLNLVGGFTTFTNWILITTNSGLATYTIPIPPGDMQRYFKAYKTASYSAAVYAPLTVTGGTIYPSNTWSLTTVTSAMSNFSFWTGNSNGQALVSVSLSNGVARVKQIMP